MNDDFVTDAYMIYSSEFETLSLPNRYFQLAIAYIQSSRAICLALINKQLSFTYPHTKVVQYLVQHSVELFFKGAISAAEKKPSQNHCLANLVKEYEEIYSEDEFKIKLPFFYGDVDCHLDSEVYEHLKQYNRTLNQRNRYPIDKEGNFFDRNEAFIPELYLQEILRLENKYLCIMEKINK